MSSVLITGGTGTFGKEFIEHIWDEYDRIVIFSRDEFKQHNMMSALISRRGLDAINHKMRFFLGDVRDLSRLKLAMRGINVVVHAAALKHVPFCEYNPSEALETNVTGTRNVCDAAISCGVEKVVCLSTDKAVEPINFYGSTKMLAERYAVHSNIYGAGKTKIACVRYGNILGSRGSLVEMLKGLPQDRPVPITHIDMTRFWMHIRDAAKMVRWSVENLEGGEIVIPKIRAAHVVRLAKEVLPDRTHIDVGIRPGEKLHEQLFDRREHEHTWDVGNYHIVLPESHDFEPVKKKYSERHSMTSLTSYFSSDKNLQMSDSEIKEICGGEN